ncbi:MAG: hypothetical protein HYU43_03235 [Armatimonadetes bacterium]|nr:hypothetical protein [Armatimonadota bacterium]
MAADEVASVAADEVASVAPDEAAGVAETVAAIGANADLPHWVVGQFALVLFGNFRSRR